MRVRLPIAFGATFLMLGFSALGVDPAAAAYVECALRSGPDGPCTCRDTRKEESEPDTVVSKDRCRAPAARPKTPAGDAMKSGAAKEKALATPGKSGASKAQPKAQQTQDPQPLPAGRSPSVEAEVKESQLETASAAAAVGPTLAQVRTRGHLICGVNGSLLGFSAMADSGEWRGFDVDFCRAVAAAALGDGSKVVFVALSTEERFEALRSGRIDLLSRNTTWTLARDAKLALEFPGVAYYDGQSFATKLESGLVSAQQLGGQSVCVLAGTTTERNVHFYFQSLGISAEVITHQSREQMLDAYKSGACGSYTADRSSLFSDRARFEEPGQHVVLPEIISKEPLGPAVRQDDPQWTKIVRWTLAGLINAEEVDLGKSALEPGGEAGEHAQRLLDGTEESAAALGLAPGWLKAVVGTVGNYAEMYERNLGATGPLGMDRGINALWKRGGILYAPPMW